jgi:hypothetical protein
MVFFHGIFEEEKKGKGPLPSFMQVDLFRALWILGQGKISRKALSQKLGIGEGSTRSILSHFSKRKMVKITRQGCSLTDAGQAALSEVKRAVTKVSVVKGSRITFNQPAFGIHLRGLAHKLKKGLEERDEAVRAGASGATVLVVKKGRFTFPGFWNNNFAKEIAEEIKGEFSPKDGDVLILGFSHNELAAERGAWNAAMYLLKKCD